MLETVSQPEPPSRPSRDLRCSACGKLISRLEWNAFKFSDTYRCCQSMNLQPADGGKHG